MGWGDLQRAARELLPAPKPAPDYLSPGRLQVTEERFGPNVVAVPFLSDAACYDLLGVLVKQSRPAHTRLALPGRQGRRALQPVGPLPNLLEQAGSEGAFAHCTREYSPNGRAELEHQ